MESVCMLSLASLFVSYHVRQCEDVSLKMVGHAKP